MAEDCNARGTHWRNLLTAAPSRKRGFDVCSTYFIRDNKLGSARKIRRLCARSLLTTEAKTLYTTGLLCQQNGPRPKTQCPLLPSSCVCTPHAMFILYFASFLNEYLTSFCVLFEQTKIFAALFARLFRLGYKISLAPSWQNRPGVSRCALVHMGSKQ